MIIIKYLTCKTDRVFKDIFLDINDQELLKGLLEWILKVKIYKIDVKRDELIEENINFRRKNLDALLDTNEGIINIEINTSEDRGLKVRNFAFLSRLYANKTLRGESYNEKEKFIQINLNFSSSDKEYKRVYYIQDELKSKYVKNIKIYEFNVDKYVKLWYTNDKEKIEENKYLIMMNLPKEELEIFSKKDKVVEKYMDKLDRINTDPAFSNIIDYERDSIMLMNSMKEEAMEKGLAEGLEKGIAEGIEKGIAEGIEKGRKEGIDDGKKEEKINIATKLLNKNMSIEEIMEITGLSKQKILNLKK